MPMEGIWAEAKKKACNQTKKARKNKGSGLGIKLQKRQLQKYQIGYTSVINMFAYIGL
jgi:hypothetical protein